MKTNLKTSLLPIAGAIFLVSLLGAIAVPIPDAGDCTVEAKKLGPGRFVIQCANECTDPYECEFYSWQVGGIWRYDCRCSGGPHPELICNGAMRSNSQNPEDEGFNTYCTNPDCYETTPICDENSALDAANFKILCQCKSAAPPPS